MDDKKVLDTLIAWGRYLNEYDEQIRESGISPGRQPDEGKP